MYSIVLEVHSILRWLIVLSALFALIRAVTGLSFKRGWMALDNQAGMWFTTLLDVQLLVGILLYFFLSPTTTAALRNFGGAMSNNAARFFAVEHVALMFVAAALAHIGRSRIRKISEPIQKHRRALIFFGLALLVILAAIPWPFLAYGRPLI
jgi:hypothetical protein